MRRQKDNIKAPKVQISPVISMLDTEFIGMIK